jgi:hypothetical protein
VLVLEVPAGTPPAADAELSRTRLRKMGETELWFHERGSAVPPTGARSPEEGVE